MLVLAILGMAAAGVLGAVLAWLALRRRQPAAKADDAELVAVVVKLGHDLRGALSPALLMSERLEASSDPEVQQAADVIVKALDRATELSREASRQVRGRLQGR